MNKDSKRGEGKLRSALSVFLTFLKIGAFTFGGGYAMLPLIRREVCEKNQWLPKEELLTMTAVAESTPGPIAVNAATYVGYRRAGFIGAFLATVGVILPAFFVVSALTLLPRSVRELPAVQYAFFGLRAGVLALIFRALIGLYKECPRKLISHIVMATAFLCVFVFKINTVWVLLGAALVGLAMTLLQKEGSDAA